MLFAENKFDEVKEILAQTIYQYGRDTALSILVIWDIIEHHYYDLNIGFIVMDLDKKLHHPKSINWDDYPTSENFLDKIESDKFNMLLSLCFSYYYSRLPWFTEGSFKGYKMSKQEKKAIEEYCLDYWFQLVGHQLPTSCCFKNEIGSFRRVRFQKFMSKKKFDDKLYDDSWLWKNWGDIFSEKDRDTNINNFAKHVIESCFPIFLNGYMSEVRGIVMGFYLRDYLKPFQLFRNKEIKATK